MLLLYFVLLLSQGWTMRKPLPLRMLPPTRRPAPVGGRKPIVRSSGPRFPRRADGFGGRLHDCPGSAGDPVHVYTRAQGLQPVDVDGDLGRQELPRLAVEDDADVDRLAPVDARHGLQDRVLERNAPVERRPGHRSQRSAAASRVSR